MSPYWAVLKARFRMLLQYRAAALAGFGTQLFWGIMRIMMFEAFYRSSSQTQPMSYEQTVTYLWLTQALLLLLPWRLDAEVRAMIRNGTVAYELVRPTDLYWFWFSRQLAAHTAPAVLRATPMFLIAGLFLGLQPPASMASAGAWVMSLFCAVALSSAIATLMLISQLWTLSGEGVSRLLGTITTLLSGSTIPYPFLPEWAQRGLAILPFRGLMDVPFRLYVGHLPPGRLPELLGYQIAWVVALILLGRWLLARGMRRLVVQGG